ncbi:hypothetical protein FGB62_23g126 [Gracilaria domingensis]|nr:hypothetical protein FGB62_23g126 [Gracilaria domingensis]
MFTCFMRGFTLNRIRYIDNTRMKASLTTSPNHTLPFETFSIDRVSQKHQYDPHFAHELQSFLDIIITQYTIWHREQRRLCELDSTHARSMPLLVFRYIGHIGLGDRIRAILYTYLIAVASKRLFLIDWKEPIPLTTVLRSPPEYNFTFDDYLFKPSEGEMEIISGPPKYADLDIYLSSKRVLIERATNPFAFKKFSSLFGRYPQLELSQKIKAAKLEHFKLDQNEVAPFILQALFRTTPSLRKSLKHLTPFKGKPYISVHARLGHGLGEKRGRFDLEEKGLTLRSASKCLGVLASTLAQKHGHQRIFVATDTERARKWLEEGIHDRLPQAEVEQSSIKATHMQRLHKPNGFPDAHEKREKFEEVFLDLGVLATGESMVYFRSGFADIALWFGVMTDAVQVTINDCGEIVGANGNPSQLLHKRRTEEYKELIRNYTYWKEERQT